MRICFVAPAIFPLMQADSSIQQIGGAELQQSIVATALASRGHDVSIVCMDHGQEDGLVLRGVEVRSSHSPSAGFPVLRFLHPRLTSTWRAMRRANADIYYQRAAGALTGFVTAFCKRNDKISVFGGAGDPDFEKNSSRIRYKRDKLIYEYGLRNVDQILVQNREQARLCQENFGRQSTIVQNCYRLDNPARSDANGYILWVSTIRKLKNPGAFLALARKCPNFEFKMIGGMGYGDEELYRSVEFEARSLPNLEFVGFLPLDKVEPYFDGARLFVNTSDSEGFPNTFLQSWSRRIPTLSFVDCGARKDGRPVGSIAQSADKLFELTQLMMCDDHQWRAAGAIAREYFEENNSLEIVVDQYETIFRNLTHGRSNLVADE